MRRSTRSSKAKQIIQPSDDSDDSEEDRSDNESVDFDSSADEWRPDDSKEKKKKKQKGKRKRVKRQVSQDDEEESDDSDREGETFLDEDDEVILAEAPAAGRRPKSLKVGTGRNKRKKIRPASTEDVLADKDILAAQAAIEAEEELERHEVRRIQKIDKEEAAQAWEQVRRRKEGGGEKHDEHKPTSTPPNTTGGLTSWLGIPDPDWPTTCEEAMINDRDSLFVGYVYALSSPSGSLISRLLSHLSKTVHPATIPTARLPPAMQHLPRHRRGATHDMHAWCCLALKRGRSGLNGPEDFGLEEGEEDDGEKYGAKQITKVIKQLGATDVLVIVSRWYGGTMLGPVRFEHIGTCARAALSKYMMDEILTSLKQQLKELDSRLASLRAQLGIASSVPTIQHDDIDYEKAERLIVARKRGVDMLQKRIEAAATESASSAPVREPTSQATMEAASAIAPEPRAPASDTFAARKPPSIPISIREQETAAITVKKESVEDDLKADLTGWDALE